MNSIDVPIRTVLRKSWLCSPASALISLILACLALAFIFPAAAADSAEPRPAQDTNSEEVLRAYLQLQEQLHATQLAVEQNRREAKEAAAQNEETLANRLHAIEQALAAQRARELDAMQSSNRVMLIVAGSFAVVGFLAMLIMAYFQWRTVNGLAELSAVLPAGRALGFGGALPALGPGELHIPNSAAAEQSNARLLGALGQLEKRLYELEHATTTHTTEPTPPTKSGNGESNGNGRGLNQERSGGSSSGAAAEGSQIRALLAKGESLLERNEANAALACFDELLTLAPDHAEALVKKGAALEKLQKPAEAIACYDQAIATDGSMTIAYLHKGGLCNRLERFNDALQCYEQALRTQEKRKM